MALSDVSNILWRERRLFALLVTGLEEAQRAFATGRVQRPYATCGIEQVLAEIKRVELERAVLVADAGSELGGSGAPTLRELTALTPPPWDGILRAHRRALRELAQEVRAVTEPSGDRLRCGRRPARAAIGAAGRADIGAFDSGGSRARRLALRILDEAI